MNERICLVNVPGVGPCVRIPVTREYPNEIVSTSMFELEELVLTQNTLVEVMYNMFSEMLEECGPTEIGWYKENEKKIEVVEEERVGFGPKIHLKGEVAILLYQVTKRWDGILIDILTRDIIHQLGNYFQKVDHRLYAGNYDSLYRKNLTKLLTYVQ